MKRVIETTRRVDAGEVQILTQQYAPYDDYWWLRRFCRELGDGGVGQVPVEAGEAVE